MNLIVSQTHEYRLPTANAISERAAQDAASGAPAVTLDMTSRYLGLVTIPGAHIVKIELEEMASQVRPQVP